MSGKELRISYDLQKVRDTRIELGGVEIQKAITGLRLDLKGSGQQPKIELDLAILVIESEIKGVETEIVLRPGVADLLIAHGWTPPVDEAE